MTDAFEATDPQLKLRRTFEKYGKLVDGRSGIFTTLREYKLPWESPIHICAGQLKPEFCFSTPRGRTAISTAVRGTGASSLQARISCLGEAVERHSGIFRGNELRRVARYAEIAEEAVHPHALTLFSEAQYNNREEWNRREGSHNWVPNRFAAERSIDWSPAWSLSRNRTKYLPTAHCYFGYPFDPEHDFCRPDSNGNAAGDILDDAIVHGFLELVERECASVWWYNRIRRPAVNLDSFDSPDILAIRNIHRMIGRSVQVLDITADRSVPVFVAVSCPEDRPAENCALGFGAHFKAQVALRKALLEISQFLPSVLSGDEPGCFVSTNERLDRSFLLPDNRLPATTASDFPEPDERGQKLEVATSAALVDCWGLEMLVLDQTRENMGMPVVKVVVPGMRGWWARFAPGRLYTLPVQLGWLAAPKAEAELNPDHLIL